jgi:transcriptional regulator with XRE-family HTH domain
VKSSKNIIGSIIKSQRQKKGLTLQELADKLETERQYVWMIENGKKNISADYLDKVIEKLNCKHEDFFNIQDKI